MLEFTFGIFQIEVVSNSVAAINHDSNEFARLAIIQIDVAGQNTQGCVQSSIFSIAKEVEDIVAVVNKCAKQNV